MNVAMRILALSISALAPAPGPCSQERDLYSEAARNLARAMTSELDVLSLELVVLEMSTESPKDDAPIVVINDSLRSQIKAFRALVSRDGARYEEDLRALLRASLVIEMLRWELGHPKRFEAVKESFSEAQWKRITAIFIDQKDLAPESIKGFLKDLLKEARKACEALIERLPK